MSEADTCCHDMPPKLRGAGAALARAIVSAGRLPVTGQGERVSLKELGLGFS